MKKLPLCLLSASLLLSSFLVTGCHDSKVIGGTLYEPVGVADESKKSPDVQYDIVWGNVVWSVIFSETLVVPVVLIGWYLWEPVGPAPSNIYRGAPAK